MKIKFNIQNIKNFFSKRKDDPKRSVHIKIFITIIFSISISIIILSIILYTYFERVILNKIFESEKNNLYQASISIKLMQDLSKSITIQMYNDYTLDNLLFIPQDDPLELFRALSSFKKYQNLISYIHSIYIYNFKNNTFYITSPASTNMIQDGETFFDKEVFECLDKPEYYNSLIPIPRVIKEPGSIERHIVEKGVYTFIFNLSGVKSYKNPGIIIINISENWLRSIIDSVDVNPDNKALIIDKEDRLLISFAGRKILSKASIYEYLKKSINEKKKSGYLVLKINKEKYFLIYSCIESFNWILIKQIPYKNLMKYISGFRGNLLVISLSLLILGMFVSFLLSKRLYKPFDNLLKEFQYLEIKRKSDSFIFKQYSLRQILDQSKKLDKYELDRIIEELSIDYATGNFISLLLLEIDKYQQFTSNYLSDKQNLFKLGILDSASNIINKKYNNEGIDLGNNLILLIINIKNENYKVYKKTIRTLAEEIQKHVETSLKISISLIISPTTNKIEDISILFEKILNISKYKFFLGCKAIITEDDISLDLNKSYTYPISKVEKIVEAINQGNKKKLLLTYNEIISFASKFGYERLKITINDIAHRIAKTVNTLKNYNYFNYSYNLNDFFSKINNIETLQELNEYFYSFFDKLIDAVKKRNRTKKHSLVSKIIKIIDNDYMKNDLSISVLADKYNISAAYLGRIFYKFTGKSMPDYINNVRINKATEFLEDNKYSISEIMKITGFTNKTHFYSMFKKYKSVTPSEYRQNIINPR